MSAETRFKKHAFIIHRQAQPGVCGLYALIASRARSCVTHWVCCGRCLWLIRPTDTGRRQDLLVSCCPGAACRNPKSWTCDPPVNSCVGEKRCLVLYKVLDWAKFTLKEIFLTVAPSGLAYLHPDSKNKQTTHKNKGMCEQNLEKIKISMVLWY